MVILLQVPAEVINQIIANKRLYNIILKNYPDVLTRRRSEANLIASTSTNNDRTNESATLSMTLKILRPKKVSESEAAKTTNIDIKNNELKEPIKLSELRSRRSDSEGPNVVKTEITQEHHKATKHTTDHSRNDLKPKVATESVATKSKGDVAQVTKNPSANHGKQQPPDSNIVQKADDFLKQISTDHHYFKDMPLYRNTIMHRGAMMNIPRYKLRAASLPNIYKNSMWSLSAMSDGEMVSWCYSIFHLPLMIIDMLFGCYYLAKIETFIKKDKLYVNVCAFL